MMPWWAAVAWAFWLGVLTSISPCPLTMNIAAVSFLGGHGGGPRAVLLSGLLYTAGQVVAYAGLGAIIVLGLTARSEVREFLRQYVSPFLGPLMILAGMAILGLLGAALSLSLAGMKVQERTRRGGAGWAAGLGVLLALSFCPGSAAIFFGGLVPLAVERGAPLFLPLIYGLGAAVPVAGLSVVMAVSSRALGTALGRLKQVERWARGLTGVLFIVVGVYCSLVYVFGLKLLSG